MILLVFHKALYLAHFYSPFAANTIISPRYKAKNFGITLSMGQFYFFLLIQTNCHDPNIAQRKGCNKTFCVLLHIEWGPPNNIWSINEKKISHIFSCLQSNYTTCYFLKKYNLYLLCYVMGQFVLLFSHCQLCLRYNTPCDYMITVYRVVFTSSKK